MEEISVNIAGFFETVMLSEEQISKSIVHNLELDYKIASQQLKADFDSLFEENIATESTKLLMIIDEVSQKLDGDKILQRKYLDEFKKKVLRYVLVSNNLEHDYQDIFAKDSMQFFINALMHFNVIDSYNNAKRGCQAICESMHRNKDYKKSVFRNKLTIPEFIVFLNSYFNVKIKAKDKLSDGWRHDDEVAQYFKRNFNQ